MWKKFFYTRCIANLQWITTPIYTKLIPRNFFKHHNKQISLDKRLCTIKRIIFYDTNSKMIMWNWIRMLPNDDFINTSLFNEKDFTKIVLEIIIQWRFCKFFFTIIVISRRFLKNLIRIIYLLFNFSFFL